MNYPNKSTIIQKVSKKWRDGNRKAAQRHSLKQCKSCGKPFYWKQVMVEVKGPTKFVNKWKPFNLDKTEHDCRPPKVKIYTKEEIEQYNKERSQNE